MRTRARSIRCFAVLAASACAGPAALAQVSADELNSAARLFTDGKFSEAAEATGKLIPRLAPGQRSLLPTLAFNRACALLAADQPDQAAESFLAADAAATDPAIRAAARYNLGQIAARQGAALAEKERDKAIEAYRRAERHFRNSLPDQPPDHHPDTAHNIEVIQRRIAKLLEEQKQEQQQQQNQQKQDQKDQQDKNQDKDQQSSDKDKQDQNQKQDSKDQQSKQDQSKQNQSGDKGKDQKNDPSNQQDAKPGDDKNESGEPKDPSKQQRDVDKQKKQAGADQDAKPVEMKPGDKREFDRSAAEILDKEKKQRERIRQLMQMMRRAAPVEKDW